MDCGTKKLKTKPKSKPESDPHSYLPSHRSDAGTLGTFISEGDSGPCLPSRSCHLAWSSWLTLCFVSGSYSPFTQVSHFLPLSSRPSSRKSSLVTNSKKKKVDKWHQSEFLSPAFSCPLTSNSSPNLVPEPTVIWADSWSESPACRVGLQVSLFVRFQYP